jgi:hypothetical protein
VLLPSQNHGTSAAAFWLRLVSGSVSRILSVLGGCCIQTVFFVKLRFICIASSCDEAKMRPMRRVGIFCGVLLVIFCVVRVLPGHVNVDLSGYRHWRVTQTKSIAGTPMTIDDMWWTQSSTTKNTFLRILCHWSNGFRPNHYEMRASLLNTADGKEISGMHTWYVPLPKTRFTPTGVTPFFWEFSATPPTGKNIRFRINYASNRLIETNGIVEPAGNPGYVDFEVPNVAIERDMSCPDIFEPSRPGAFAFSLR